MNPHQRVPFKLLIRQLSCGVGCAVGLLIYPAISVRLFQRTLKLDDVTCAESGTAPEYSNGQGLQFGLQFTPVRRSSREYAHAI